MFSYKGFLDSIIFYTNWNQHWLGSEWKKYIFICMCVHSCVPVACVCVHAHRGQKMTLGPLELGCRQFKLPDVGAGNEWGFFARACNALNTQPPLQPWMKTFLRNGVQPITWNKHVVSFSSLSEWKESFTPGKNAWTFGRLRYLSIYQGLVLFGWLE